jgi:hypothetical protein
MSNVVVKHGSAGPMFAYKPGGTALLNFEASAGKKSSISSPAEFNQGGASPEEELGKTWFIPWGDTNDFPRKIALLMRRSTVGRSGLQLLSKAIYGQRLYTYKVVDTKDNGQPIIQTVALPEWDAVTARSNFNMVRLGLIQDYTYFGICFPEIRFNGNKTQVWGIDYHKATHTRFAPIDPDNGRIPNVFISGRWPYQVSIADTQQLPVIDPIRYYDQIAEIKSNYTDFKYVMPLYWPDVLNDYYPVVYWDSSRDWIEIATSIPAYKKALFKNQMSLKYDIQIPMEYMTTMYPNFQGMPIEEKDKIVDELYDEIVSNLTGAENAQKAILSFYSTGKDGKPMGQWIIKAIDDIMKNDAYLPDAAAANSEILFSMLVNPATIGQGNTGGDYTGGANNGGSNIRESGLQLRSMLQADRDITLGYFNFFKQYNNIDPDICLGVQDMVLTTLDQGAGTKGVLS